MLRVHPNLGYDMTATAGATTFMRKLCDSLHRTDVGARRKDCPRKARTRQLAVMPSFSFLEGISQIGHRCTRRGRDSCNAIARSRRRQPVPYLSAKILTGRGPQKLCRESAVCEERTYAATQMNPGVVVHNYLLAPH